MVSRIYAAAPLCRLAELERLVIDAGH